MRGKAVFAVGMMALATLGVVGAAGPGCATGEVPDASVVAAAFAGTPYELLTAPATLPGPAPPEGQTEGVFHGCQDKIRPGAPVVFNNSYLCTLNFIFRDQAGAFYAGTAGHCIPASLPSMTIRVGSIPGDIGDPAYSTGNAGVGTDFALIRIDPAYYSRIETSMCRWGGPTGQSTAGGQQALFHYGWGVLWGEEAQTRGRASALRGVGANDITFAGPAGPGDSGSAIENQAGQAIGILTHGSPVAGLPVGTVYGTRIDRALSLANAAQPAKGYRLMDGSVPLDLTGLSVPE